MHGQDAAGDELSVLPDGKVPRLDPHQVIEGELQYQTALCTNLDTDHMVSGRPLSSSARLSPKQAGRRPSADSEGRIWNLSNRRTFDFGEEKKKLNKQNAEKVFISVLEFIQGFCNMEAAIMLPIFTLLASLNQSILGPHNLSAITKM